MNADEIRLALIAAREARGMTQAHVAEAMWMTRSAVSQFEKRDARSFRLTTVLAYAEVVGVRLVVTR